MLAVLDDRLCVHGPGISVRLAGWRRWRAADMPPFAGRHAVCLPESAAEGGGIGEAPASGDRGDGLVTPARTDQVVPGRVEPALEDPLAQGPRLGFPELVQLPDRDVHRPRYRLRAEVRVGEMLGDVAFDQGCQALLPAVTAERLLIDGRDERRPHQVRGRLSDHGSGRTLGDGIGVLEQDLEMPSELRGDRAGMDSLAGTRSVIPRQPKLV